MTLWKTIHIFDRDLARCALFSSLLCQPRTFRLFGCTIDHESDHPPMFLYPDIQLTRIVTLHLRSVNMTEDLLLRILKVP